MYFNDNIKGKIVIEIDKCVDELNSKILFKGLAKDKNVALSTLLINYVLLAKKLEKDPIELLKKNMDQIDKLTNKKRQS